MGFGLCASLLVLEVTDPEVVGGREGASVVGVGGTDGKKSESGARGAGARFFIFGAGRGEAGLGSLSLSLDAGFKVAMSGYISGTWVRR